MTTQDTIETERLFLRRWRESDLHDLNEYGRQLFVALRAGFEPHKSIDDSKTILDRFILDETKWAIELKDGGKVIGSIGLEIKDKNRADLIQRERKIGFVLNEQYHGQGYATEATKAMMTYGFTVLKLFLIRITHCEANRQSRRVIEKCGFHFDGVKRFHNVWKYDGVLHHYLDYSLTVDEWKANAT